MAGEVDTTCCLIPGSQIYKGISILDKMTSAVNNVPDLQPVSN